MGRWGAGCCSSLYCINRHATLAAISIPLVGCGIDAPSFPHVLCFLARSSPCPQSSCCMNESHATRDAGTKLQSWHLNTGLSARCFHGADGCHCGAHQPDAITYASKPSSDDLSGSWYFVDWSLLAQVSDSMLQRVYRLQQISLKRSQVWRAPSQTSANSQQATAEPASTSRAAAEAAAQAAADALLAEEEQAAGHAQAAKAQSKARNAQRGKQVSALKVGSILLEAEPA